MNDNNQRVVLKCCRCQKLYSVSLSRWQKLLNKWGTVPAACENYLCKTCELPVDVVPNYEEKSHEIEDELLSATIDGSQYNTQKVVSFLKKVATLRRLWRTAPIKVVTQEDLQKYFDEYMKQKKEVNNNGTDSTT